MKHELAQMEVQGHGSLVSISSSAATFGGVHPAELHERVLAAERATEERR